MSQPLTTTTISTSSTPPPPPPTPLKPMNAKINEAFSITDEYDYLNTINKSPSKKNIPSTNAQQTGASTSSALTLVKLTREQIEKEFYEYTLECRRRLDQLFTTTTTTDASTSSRNSPHSITTSQQPPLAGKKTNSDKSSTMPSRNNLVSFSAASGNYRLFKVMPPAMSIRDVESNKCRQSNQYVQPLTSTMMTSVRNQHQKRHKRDVEDENTIRLYRSFKRPTMEKIWHI
jgi:hypothetical protein